MRAVLKLAAAVGVVAAYGVQTAPAAAAPLPWAPPPVNSCGETGYDPALRQPNPNAPQNPALPPRIDIPLPYPQIVPVPVPGPPPNNTRVQMTLPANPCADPCPDLTDTPNQPPGSGSAGSSGSSDSSLSSGSSGSAGSNALPDVRIKPESVPIPIPIPGGPQPPLPPAPPPVVNPIEPGPVTAPVPAPAIGRVDLVGQLTGHGSQNRTDKRWQVDGTDLGITWETKPGEVAVAFGDTFGRGWELGGAGADTADWRSNTLGFSTDRELSDGMRIDRMVTDSRCHAAEVLESRHVQNYEQTTIPTSGFAIGNRQYLSYMSINRFSRIPGLWLTNYGGLAYSDDDGQTWTKDEYARWDNIFGGTGNFQVATMVPHGDYIYMFGTPNGRRGSLGLARVAKADVLNKSAYQYWVNGSWAPSAQNQATPIFSGAAGEVSARFDEGTGRWQISYLDVTRGDILLRDSASPQGVWSDPVPLVSVADYPTAYGGYLHPWSSGNQLYFAMSAWNSYNVYLMRAQLN